MIYNLSNPDQAIAAENYMNKLHAQQVKIEIKRIRANRSLNQNSYLHLLLGAFGLEFGYTLEEAKQIYKDLNKDTYYYSKNKIIFTKSSAELDTKEMTDTIDNFRRWSLEQGCYLPPASNKAELESLENAIEKSGYL